MERKELNGLMAEINAKLEMPSPAEVSVNPEAIKSRALEMAKQGYQPTEAALAALELYLKGYGLWLSGDVGTGKTMFFQLLRPLNILLRRTGRAPAIVIFPMVRTLEMSVADIKEWLDENYYNEVVLDDVGAEPVFNHFGGKFDILPYILDKRLDSPCRTHATSNLKAKAMALRYNDERVLDRFAEMFVKVPFTGASFRRSQPNRLIRATQEAALRAKKPAAPGGKGKDESNEKPPSRPSPERAG